MALSPPEPLLKNHVVDLFSCGEVTLDEWLVRRAIKNQLTGASRTYVVCDKNRVVAYYSLSSSAISVVDTKGKFRRNMPDPIPVVVLGRLAVDMNYQGSGIGRALIRDAGIRVVRASELIGIRGIIVHALSAEVSSFYQQMGFTPSKNNPMILMITLDDIKALL